MRHTGRPLQLLLALLSGCLIPVVPSYAAQSPSPAPDYLAKARQLLDGYDRDRVVAQIRELYEEAKASGERVPVDLWGWVREDLGRVGVWQYRVVKAGAEKPEELESELNALGRDRWECLSVSPGLGGKQLVLVLKRPAKSYLGQLNLRDVLRVLPDRN